MPNQNSRLPIFWVDESKLRFFNTAASPGVRDDGSHAGLNCATPSESDGKGVPSAGVRGRSFGGADGGKCLGSHCAFSSGKPELRM
jgi:hypothetical protein